MKIQTATKKCLLFLAPLLFYFGCSLKSLEDPIVVADLEKEFYINLWEELSPGSPSLHFNIRTIGNEDCLNYTIDTDFDRSGSRVELSFNDIVAPQDCVPGEGPATAEITAGYLTTGFYEFSVSLRNTVINKGTLEVYNNYYRVFMDTEEGIVFPHTKLQRVPANTIWGYVGYEEADEASAAEEFLNGLQEKTSSHSLTNGYYGYFTITGSTNQLVLREPPGSTNFKTFSYLFPGELTELRSFVDDFRAGHPAGVKVQLYTWTGEEL